MIHWWQQQPSIKAGTATGYLASGVRDVEKGDIYSISAGTPVSLPVPARVAWEDSQHVVLVTTQGVLNFLHVNPTVRVGSLIPSGHTFGKVSDIGSSGHPNSFYDSSSGITYVESGNIIEFGSYDTVQRAISRDNFVNGIDQPFNFSGIFNPSRITNAWKSGKTPQDNPPNTMARFGGGETLDSGLSIMGMNPIIILVVIIVALILLRKL